MNPQDPTQRMREILETLARDCHRKGYEQYDIDSTAFWVEQALAELSKLMDEATKDAYDLLYWQYKELNGQSVDMKFAEAYGILVAALQQPNQPEEKGE